MRDGGSPRGQQTKSTAFDDPRAVTLFVGLGFIGCIVGTVFFALNGREDLLCNEVNRINPKEQPMCTPPKTQDVKVKWSASYIKAYRYAQDNLTIANTIINSASKLLTVKTGNHESAKFALQVGGTINFTFTSRDDPVDAYLMTHEQYNTFEKKGHSKSEWSKLNTLSETTHHIARQTTTYFIVFGANDGDVDIRLDVNTTTFSYNVSKESAKETCPKACTFKNVQSNEVVIAEYYGSYSASLEMYSGKGALSDNKIFPLILLCLVTGCFGVGFCASIRKSRQAAKNRPKPRNELGYVPSSLTASNEAPLIQQQVTPEGDFDSVGTAPVMSETDNYESYSLDDGVSEYDGSATLNNV